MSKKNVASFLQAISTRNALTERLKSIRCSADLLAVAAEFGYEFTEQELLAGHQKPLQMTWI
ncbi:MAG: Nif11-like leader peptide family natural product precursor [Cyanobacteria bacterium J06635_1]